MENLAPRAAYDETESGFWVRIAVLAGLFYGAGMALLQLLDPSTLRSGTAVLVALLGWVVGGMIFGVTFAWLMRRSLRKALDRIYAGDPKLVEPPPPGREYRYRLPCAMVSGRVTIGGVLYLGPQGAVFHPHRRNVRRHRAPVFLEPVEALRARLVEYTRPRAARLLLGTTRHVLELSAGETAARLVVPWPEITLAVVESRIAALSSS